LISAYGVAPRTAIALWALGSAGAGGSAAPVGLKDNPATTASTTAAEVARMLHRVPNVDRANMVLLLLGKNAVDRRG
jgi:hypothetical protein